MLVRLTKNESFTDKCYLCMWDAKMDGLALCAQIKALAFMSFALWAFSYF